MKTTRDQKDTLKALMAEEVNKNVDRPYEEMRDVNELIADYRDAGDLSSMALVKYKEGQLAIREEDNSSGDELQTG